MSGFLLLLGGDDPDAPLSWALADAEGVVLQRGVAAPPAHNPARTVLVIPASDARLSRLDLPAETEAQARAAAAILLERAHARSDDLHFAVGAKQSGSGARLVAAVSRGRLASWLEACRRVGADPHVVTLDCVVWPVEAGEIAIATHGARTIVAGGELGGFAIESDLAPAVFARWRSEAGAQDTRIVIYGDAEPWRALTSQVRPPLDALDALARGVAEAGDAAPNLRQGEFAAAQQSAPPWRFWRFAALLAVAALSLQIVTQVVAGWRDRQTAERVLAAAERDFRESRPDVGRIVNLRAQTAALLNAVEAGARHPVLTASAPVISALNAQPLARIDEVHHENPGRSVRVIISAPQPQMLEAVVAALRAQSIAFEQRDAQPREGRFAVEIVLEAP